MFFVLLIALIHADGGIDTQSHAYATLDQCKTEGTAIVQSVQDAHPDDLAGMELKCVQFIIPGEQKDS